MRVGGQIGGGFARNLDICDSDRLMLLCKFSNSIIYRTKCTSWKSRSSCGIRYECSISQVLWIEEDARRFEFIFAAPRWKLQLWLLSRVQVGTAQYDIPYERWRGNSQRNVGRIVHNRFALSESLLTLTKFQERFRNRKTLVYIMDIQWVAALIRNSERIICPSGCYLPKLLCMMNIGGGYTPIVANILLIKCCEIFWLRKP